MVVYFAIWFVAGLACCNTTAEIVRAKMDKELSMPFLLGLSQSIWCLVFSFIQLQILTHCSNYSLPTMKNPKLWPWLWKIASVYSVGFICVNQSLVVMAIPLIQTLRSVEPIITVFLLAFCLPDIAMGLKSFPLCAILPLMATGGVCLFVGQNNFPTFQLSFFLAMLSTVLFSIKSIVYKQIQSEFSTDAMALFYSVSKLSVVINFLFFLTFNGRNVGSLWQLGEMLEGRLPFLLFLNGVAFFASSRVSFLILHQMPIESHAVGNGLQKTAMVLLVTFLHSASVQPVTIIGVGVAFVTLFLYVTRMDFSNNSNTNSFPQQHSYSLLHEQFTQAQARQKNKKNKKKKDSTLDLSQYDDSDAVKVNIMTTSPLYISGPDNERIVSTEVGNFEMIM